MPNSNSVCSKPNKKMIMGSHKFSAFQYGGGVFTKILTDKIDPKNEKKILFSLLIFSCVELDSYKGLWWQFLSTNAAKLTLSFIFIFFKHLFDNLGYFFHFFEKRCEKIPLRRKMQILKKKDKSKNSKTTVSL